MKRSIIVASVFLALFFGMIIQTTAREAQAEEFVFFRHLEDCDTVNLRTIPAGNKFILGDIVAQIEGPYSEPLSLLRNGNEIVRVRPPAECINGCGGLPWSHQFKDVVFEEGQRLGIRHGGTPCVSGVDLYITITGREVNM